MELSTSEQKIPPKSDAASPKLTPRGKSQMNRIILGVGLILLVLVQVQASLGHQRAALLLFLLGGTSRLDLTNLVSNEEGILSFGVVAGEMGLDSITASVGDAKIEFAVNVISLRATGFPQPPVIEGALSWSALFAGI